MSLKRRKKGENSIRESAANDLHYRTFSVRESSINLEKRTIDAIVATENPVLMPDWERGEMVPEILLVSGAELPSSRQVPLLDNHQRRNTDDQLGSVRALAQGQGELTGTLHFSASSEKQWTKVREGHITDVSAGYQVVKKTYVAAGETKVIAGRSFTGPANVATKWRAREVSVTPIGADEQAKLRGFDPTAIFTKTGEWKMDPELKALLVARGMSAELDDAAAQKWQVEDEKKRAATPPVVPPKLTPIATGLSAEEVRKLFEESLAKERAAAIARENEYRETCELADVPELLPAVRALPDITAVRAAIIAHKAKLAADNPLRPSGSLRITGEGRERFFADVGTALSMRAVESSLSAAPDNLCQTPEQIGARMERTKEQVFPTATRSKGADQWRNASIFQMAEECLRIDGVDTRGWTRDEVAIAAMFGVEAAKGHGYRAGGVAISTTGSFTNLTLDAVNKSMMTGYTQCPVTWRGPMRQGQSVADFKTIHRVRMGAIPNLPIWPDDTDPIKAKFADAQEKYAVESRSLEIGFSYRLLVNDDMSALTRVPSMMGMSAARTVNAVAWGVITSNPTMNADSVALFSTATGNRKRSNKTTGTNAITTANIQISQNLMMQMRGENTPEQAESNDVLALMPKYLVAPSGLYQSAIVVTRSAFDPVASQFQNFNIASLLTAVIEPLLDADSATKWYLFADPSQIDTVEVTFLQGQESPVVRNFVNPQTLTQNFTVLQTFGAAALNHRGMQYCSD